MKKTIPKKSDNIAEWYTRVILEADLADYGPAKGTMIIKPYGFAIWEQVRKAMDPLMSAHGIENAYFPLFIPMSLLNKEKSHIEGFSPELAVVTHGGGEKLEEPLAIRPTSETVMYHSYAQWIQSWRDLPMMMNQWNNVVRWEKRTYLFMRTSEFLWQEGHTAHRTHAEVTELQNWALQLYEKIYKDYFAIFGYVGRKSQSERFAGANTSLSYEALMPTGKALQSATSHDLGQNFSKVFDIKFQDQDKSEQFVWQTSWGLSTRSIGGLILTHGDDNGLRLPPKLAPIQVIILPVRIEAKLMDYCRAVEAKLVESGIRVKVDDRDDETIGYRINKWELKGVPLRIEVGEREVNEKQVTIARRDDGDKKTLPLEEAVAHLPKLLDVIQEGMLAASREFTKENTYEANNYDEFKSTMKEHRGFIRVPWSDDPQAEAAIQKETKATSRCLTAEGETKKGTCFYSGKPDVPEWIFAQSY